MKQLHLFFPHLFPLYWVTPEMPAGLLEKLVCEKSEITEMRVTLLEKKQELLSEYFDKALEILSTPRRK
jgi:hypothetical protein